MLVMLVLLPLTLLGPDCHMHGGTVSRLLPKNALSPSGGGHSLPAESVGLVLCPRCNFSSFSATA